MSVPIRGLHSRNDVTDLHWYFVPENQLPEAVSSINREHPTSLDIIHFLDGATLESNQTVLSQATAHLETQRFLSHERRAGERLLQGLSGRSRTNCPIDSKHWVFLAQHASLLKNDARMRLSPLALDRRGPHQRTPDAQVLAAGHGMLQVRKTIDFDNKNIPLGSIHS